MRTAYYSDLVAAARVLLAVPSDERAQLSKQLLFEAEIADRLMRRTGKMHATWGNGTLSDAARRRRMMAERDFDDPEYCECFCEILKALCRRPRSEGM